MPDSAVQLGEALALTQQLALTLGAIVVAAMAVSLALRVRRQRRRWAAYRVEDDSIARRSGAEVWAGEETR